MGGTGKGWEGGDACEAESGWAAVCAVPKGLSVVKELRCRQIGKYVKWVNMYNIHTT